MIRTLLVVGVLATATGCGGSVSVGKPDTLKGSTIAAKANAQLEKQNTQIRHGSLTCADVKYEKGATTRCLRTVDLDQGRRVKIGATVRITDTDGGGHYAIQVDKVAKEFGQTGASIEQDLASQYAKKFRTGTPQVSCPDYLKGVVGTTITCSLKADTGAIDVEVKVVSVDPKTFATQYTFKQV